MQKIFFTEVDSTMDEARREAEFLESNSHLMVVADRQVSGRGQKGKRWESDSGGVYFTIASSLEDGFNLSGYSLFIGILLNKTFSNFNIETKLKWPNDVFDLSGRKLSGVLIETYKNKDKQILLTGIGINLNNIPNVEIETTSVSNLAKQSVSRLDILKCFEEVFEKELLSFMKNTFKQYSDLWNNLNYYKDKSVSFDNGKEVFKGISKGVDSKGKFLLEIQNKELSFVSGNITV